MPPREPTSDLMLEHLTPLGLTDRVELVLVDRGAGVRPIWHAWRVEVAHRRVGRSRRLAKSSENTTTSARGGLQVACIATMLRHLSKERGRRRPGALAA